VSARPPNRPDGGAEEIDPQLAGLVGAILDGGTVDWPSFTDSFRDELRIVADVAGVHRSLALAEVAGDAPAFPPRLPWDAGALRITASLGRGAFGEVFRAWDTQLHRDVALKLLFQDRGHEADADRFLEEGRLLAKIRHPNVVTVYGAERLEGRVGLITEFVDGQTLAEVVRDGGPLSAGEVLSIGRDLCRALGAVHEAGLLHRDIKPQNVMRDADGRIVLMDFGAGHRGEAMAQALAGTPLFLAPEVLDEGPATVQSDVYSLGVLLHYLATGSYPVTGASLAQIRHNHMEGQRTRVRAVRPDLPRRIADAIDRATDPDPSRRYATAQAFEAALARSLELPGSARRIAYTAGAIAAAVVLMTVAAARDWITVPGMSRAGGGIPAPEDTVSADVASTTVRQVPLKGVAMVGRPSRDGRWLPYTDPDGHLWIWEVRTGRTQQVAKNSTTREVIWDSLMSPDGQQIAYAWEGPGRAVELRVVAAGGGGEPTTIWPSGGVESSGAGITPFEWSRDGRHILHLLKRQDGSSELALIARDGADRRVLASFRTGAPRQASLSPDGYLVVFDPPSGDRAIERDLMIVRTDGSSAPQPLLTGAANDLHPSWTPDGSGIFFVSNRSGQMSGWLLPMAGEQIAGEATFVAKNLGRIWPLGLTDTGGYFYLLQVGAAEVFTVAVDLTGATPPGPPTRVSDTDALDHLGAAWSPDGRSIAYIAQSKDTAWDRGSHWVVIQDLASRRTRELHVAALSRLGVLSPRWSADSRHLLVRGADIENREGLFIIDAETGAIIRPILLGPTNRFDWSRDQQSIVYRRDFQQIISRAIATGRETVLFDAPAHDLRRVSSFAVSPDGRTMALSGPSEDQRWGLFLYSPERGLTEIHAANNNLVVQAWTPDGTQLLFTAAGPQQQHRLMRIHTTGGEAVDTGITIHGFPMVNRVVLNPDGTRIAYTAGEPSVQAWMMEHFLPQQPLREP
jgi:eukaryotic-like serine/threonine-protein kinase